jgi:hypothetical protein
MRKDVVSQLTSVAVLAAPVACGPATGADDGAPGQPFCRNGSWVSDKYDGATLTMPAGDNCADPDHLDLAQNSLHRHSLDRLAKGGRPVGELYPNHRNNRRISRQFVPIPDYSGDIRVGFIQSAQPYWPVVAISHPPDGIHGLQHYSNGAGHAATTDSDVGKDYQIAPTTTLPSTCATGCGPA